MGTGDVGGSGGWYRCWAEVTWPGSDVGRSAVGRDRGAAWQGAGEDCCDSRNCGGNDLNGDRDDVRSE